MVDRWYIAQQILMKDIRKLGGIFRRAQWSCHQIYHASSLFKPVLTNILSTKCSNKMIQKNVKISVF